MCSELNNVHHVSIKVFSWIVSLVSEVILCLLVSLTVIYVEMFWHFAVRRLTKSICYWRRYPKMMAPVIPTVFFLCSLMICMNKWIWHLWRSASCTEIHFLPSRVSHMVHSPLIPVISICPLKVELHILTWQIFAFFCFWLDHFFNRFLTAKQKYMSSGLVLIQKHFFFSNVCLKYIAVIHLCINTQGFASQRNFCLYVLQTTLSENILKVFSHLNKFPGDPQRSGAPLCQLDSLLITGPVAFDPFVLTYCCLYLAVNQSACCFKGISLWLHTFSSFFLNYICVIWLVI